MSLNGCSPAARFATDFLRRADLVVGIATRNHAATIREVVRAVYDGLARFFPQFTAVVVHADAGSIDETLPQVLAARRDDEHLLTLAVPGQDAGLRLIFDVATRLGAKACAVVNPDLRSLSPDWIDRLLRPVLFAHIDLVVPVYHRHKYEAGITTQLTYPLTRMLYGSGVRPPLSGEFGLSGRLLESLASRSDWEEDAAGFGRDLGITTLALAGNFSVGHGFLGPLIRASNGPGLSLGTLLRQVTGSVFALMLRWEKVWPAGTGSRAVPHFGGPAEMSVEPLPVRDEPLIDAFRQGARDLGDLWRMALGAGSLARVQQAAGAPVFAFPADLWVPVVLDFACAFKNQPWHRDHLLASFAPLYLGRLAAVLRENEPLPAGEVEARLEQLCLSFERAKPALIRQWHGDPLRKEEWPDGRYVSSPA